MTDHPLDALQKWGSRRRIWFWPEVEAAFALVYVLQARQAYQSVTDVYEKLGDLLGRSRGAVATYLNRFTASHPDLVNAIEEKLKTQQPVPMEQGLAYVERLTGNQVSKRKKAQELYLMGYSRKKTRDITGALTLIPEVRYDLNAFFKPPKDHGTQGHSVIMLDRFAPERAPEKERARSQIIAIAKEHLFQPALAFDLPGEGGHSSRKFKEAFPDIKIFGAESTPEIAKVIRQRMATSEIPLEHLYECNASDAFKAHANALLRPFDLVNLDTCGRWSESLVITVNALFNHKLLANNGLLVVTHLAVRDERKSPRDALYFALNLNMPPRVGEMSLASRTFSRDEVRHLISGFIQRSAVSRGYNLTPLVDPFEYADDPRSPMSVYIFKAEYPVTDQQACQSKADLLEFEWAKCMLDPNKKGKFIEYLVNEYLRELGSDEREEFNERLVTILHAAEMEE